MKGFFSLYQRNYYLSQSSIVQRQFWRKNSFQGVSNQVGKLPKFQGVGGLQQSALCGEEWLFFGTTYYVFNFLVEKNWVYQDPFCTWLNSIKNRQFPLFPMFIVPVSFKQKTSPKEFEHSTLIFICLFLPKNC